MYILVYVITEKTCGDNEWCFKYYFSFTEDSLDWQTDHIKPGELQKFTLISALVCTLVSKENWAVYV